MPQLLYYIEVTTWSATGQLVDVHESMSGGLPILYKNPKKAIKRIVQMENALRSLGYQTEDQVLELPITMTHPYTAAKKLICIREVHVNT